MVFGLVVNEGPYQHQASDTAYNFARAVIGTGHSIIRVFFYHDGVYNGTRLVVPPQDDRAVTERWSEFAETHQVDLVLCVAAAHRRGILDESERQRNGKDAENLAAGFRISGIGQLVEAAILADRMVVFGD